MKTLLEAEKQEPVEHCLWARNGNTPCPQAREPLTDEQFMELLRKDPHLYGRSIYFVYKKGEVEFAGTDGLGLHTPAVLSDDVRQIKRILEAAYGIGEKNT